MLEVMKLVTPDEATTILGILEDLVGEDDFSQAYSYETRMKIYGLIKKFGGTYFGKDYAE